MADDENVSLADNTNESQTSATESQIMSGEIIHSTPVPTNRADENQIVKMMQALFSEQKNEFNEVKNEIRKQNIIFDRRINEIDVRCTNMQEQVVEIVNEKFDAKINDLDDKINTINETVTVSYTHLDVYKRQLFH